ncbi:MAG: hypothetical protein IPH44_43560 [Myxococcales bacterium]|nr:hypothetical protein [Myxococcales bacterium]
MELKLERDGHWDRFEQAAVAALGRSWAEVKGNAIADDDFSAVMATLFPGEVPGPDGVADQPRRHHLVFGVGRGGRQGHRRHAADPHKQATLFVVIDEVSQYVHQDNGRMLKLRSRSCPT